MGKKLSFRLTVLFCCIILCGTGFAQDKPAMADLMRSNGKIYDVVAVCLTILVGLFLYMVTIDRRMRKMEKENKQEK